MWTQIRPRVRGIYYALTGESIPLHRGEQNQPFFIVGSGRCGTTLLRRILQASSEVHIPPESWGLGYAIHHFKQNQWYLDWAQIVDIVVSTYEHRSHDWFESPPTQLVDELSDWPSERRSLYSLLDRIYRYHGEAVGAEFTRWGDKTPLHVGYMGTILEVFPDARFIHLVRDGVDVAYSWSQVEHEESEDLIGGAKRWVGAVSEARSFSNRHPEKLIEIRYEEMCRKPEQVTKRICRFIDLPYDPDLPKRTDHFDQLGKAQSVEHFKNAFEQISTGSIGKGRQQLTPEQKARVADVLNGSLTRTGYDPVEA